MKKLLTLWLKLTDKNFNTKLKSARLTHKMIVASTNGRLSHFIDSNGTRIRGFSNTKVKTRVKNNYHPLIEKYQ